MATLLEPATVILSAPAPEDTVSKPAPTFVIVSAPSPVVIVSLPEPPSMESAPAPVTTVRACVAPYDDKLVLNAPAKSAPVILDKLPAPDKVKVRFWSPTNVIDERLTPASINWKLEAPTEVVIATVSSVLVVPPASVKLILPAVTVSNVNDKEFVPANAASLY